MENNKKNCGMPIFGQLLSYIDKGIVYRTARKYKSDKYYKKFMTYEHMVTMIYLVVSGATSLRELMYALLACNDKLIHFGMGYFPKRSTIAEANEKRSSSVFLNIYNELYKKNARYLPDSRYAKIDGVEDLNIVDSTTISLFSDIIRGAGRTPIEGKKKGGLKVHTVLNSQDDVPIFIHFSDAAKHDVDFLQELKFPKGSFVVFDKGYNSYDKYDEMTQKGVYFVTRQKSNASYKKILELPEAKDPEILIDEKIELEKNNKEKFELRRIAYWYEKDNRTFEYITNNFDLEAEKIVQIYKNRWQIELMFKRLKQNFPLKYFIGESRNSIEIQIIASLIVQLVMLIIQKKAKKRWSFSNLVAVIRFHLISYMNLLAFLEKSESDYWFTTKSPPGQLNFF